MTTEGIKTNIPIYKVDAFTEEPFRGNPAAVCLLPREVVRCRLFSCFASQKLKKRFKSENRTKRNITMSKQLYSMLNRN